MKRILLTCLTSLLIPLLAGCNLVKATPDSETPISMIETPSEGITSGEPSLPETPTVDLPQNLIAFYPLISDLNDLTGKNTPATTFFGTPTADGFFCDAFCNLTTPVLNGFNINTFTIRTEFLEPKYPVFRDAVFVGGEYRWTRFVLLPDGEIALSYNNDEVTCSGHYQVNYWHEAVITYNGTTLQLYLDGAEGCSIDIQLITNGNEYITLRDNGYGSSFIGSVRNLQVFNTVEIPQTFTPQPGTVPSADSTLSPADLILASCPTEAELALIDSDVTLVFESDPSISGLVCTLSEGSRDLTSFKRIVYTTLLVMKQLEFNQPLPWTDKQLYAWFVDTITGLRFRSDIQYSSCCDPSGVINIQTNLAVNNTDRWIDPQLNTGAMDLMALFIHEARHNEHGGHTCGNNDNTRTEMGSWGVQYYFYTYLVNNLQDPAFLKIPDPSLSVFYFDITSLNADLLLGSSFCMDQ